MSSEQKAEMNEYLEMTLISLGVIAVMSVFYLLL